MVHQSRLNISARCHVHLVPTTWYVLPSPSAGVLSALVTAALCFHDLKVPSKNASSSWQSELSMCL